MLLTQDEIIRMAREAGGGLSCIAEPFEHPWKFTQAELERFAELVCDALITKQKAMYGVQMAGCDTPYDEYTLEPLYYKEQMEAIAEATKAQLQGEPVGINLYQAFRHTGYVTHDQADELEAIAEAKVEAAIEATLEKAAKVCEERCEGWGQVTKWCAAAIRSMK